MIVFVLLMSSAPALMNQNDEVLIVGDVAALPNLTANDTETLWLDTYSNLGYPTIFSQYPLEDQRPYQITIEGTWSNWPTGHWNDEDDPPVGPFENAPMYPSQAGGERTGRVGADVFWMFACIWGDDYARDNGVWPLPVKFGFRTSLDNGTSWNTLRPIDDVYSSTHNYKIIVVGKGENIGFRLPDYGSYDNYGMLKIVIEADHDSDGDSLWDYWEKKGIDFDQDGSIDLNLSALGADWEHKDIFVEADYMNGNRPDTEALEDVEAAFSNAQVSNPDNIKGINLHVLLDEGVPWKEFTNFAEYYDLKNKYLGTEEERSNVNTIQAKKLVYRYCLFVNKLSINGVNARCPGVAEGIVCDDFILAFGAFPDGIGSRDDQAAVFMHELGHALGLHHGGNTSVNYKPNYLSIMNYAFEFNDYLPTRPLDYSYGKCIDLNESNLDELKGTGQQKATVFLAPNKKIYTDPTGTSIDWDINGLVDNRSVDLNINNFDGSSPSGETLRDFNDWENLVYKFRGTPLSAASAFFDDYHIELTTDQIEQMEADGANITVIDSPTIEDTPTQFPMEVVIVVATIVAIALVLVVVLSSRRRMK
ncbi:MAG: hypothetical protein WC375_02565 [Methanomassiliicoccales archaeon]|jgi:hypothetical protein